MTKPSATTLNNASTQNIPKKYTSVSSCNQQHWCHCRFKFQLHSNKCNYLIRNLPHLHPVVSCKLYSAHFTQHACTRTSIHQLELWKTCTIQAEIYFLLQKSTRRKIHQQSVAVKRGLARDYSDVYV